MRKWRTNPMTYITKKLKEFDEKFCLHAEGIVDYKSPGEPIYGDLRDLNPDILADEIEDFIKQALEEQEREIKQNIGFLRQWLNERIEAAVILHNEPSTQRKLITNEDIEMWLFDFCPDKKPKNLLEAKKTRLAEKGEGE